jgi:hypothetical protein
VLQTVAHVAQKVQTTSRRNDVVSTECTLVQMVAVHACSRAEPSTSTRSVHFGKKNELGSC